MGSLKILTLKEADEALREKIDIFIENNRTTGEFINTVKYLSYHPADRFTDDSVVVVETGSMTIKGVMMAAESREDSRILVSHPGTTFAGPVVENGEKIRATFEILELIFDYYEAKYEEIQVRLVPSVYMGQACERVEYFLQRRGYLCRMNGLANLISLHLVKTNDDILSLCKAKKRNHIRKAMKEEKFIVQKSAEIRKDVWMNMNQNLSDKFSAKTTHTYEEMIDLQKRFPDRIIPYYALTEAGDYGAFALIYKFKNVYHTQYLDLNYKYSGSYPNLLLLFSLIEKAVNEKYSVFSFGVSTENGGQILNEGLFEYKAGYGGGEILLKAYEWKRRS